MKLASIDVEAALLTVEEDFQRWLAALPGDMSRVAEQALERMAIRPDRPARWTRRLSPLVTLYPALQAQVIATASGESIRELSLAHLQLIVHGFLSDRQLDGQLALTPEESVLSTQALLSGVSTLDVHAIDSGASRAVTLDLLRRHHQAQLSTYDDERRSSGDLDAGVESLVADRALLGWLATRLLLESAPDLGARAKEAFDHLVVGLQWTDDLVDWSQDLDRGQENLLLRQLPLGAIDAVALSDVDVERGLIEEGIYGRSFATIDHHLARAQEIQMELGAVQLSFLIGQLRSEMEALRRRLEGLVSEAASGFELPRRSSG